MTRGIVITMVLLGVILVAGSWYFAGAFSG